MRVRRSDAAQTAMEIVGLRLRSILAPASLRRTLIRPSGTFSRWEKERPKPLPHRERVGVRVRRSDAAQTAMEIVGLRLRSILAPASLRRTLIRPSGTFSRWRRKGLSPSPIGRGVGVRVRRSDDAQQPGKIVGLRFLSAMDQLHFAEPSSALRAPSLGGRRNSKSYSCGFTPRYAPAIGSVTQGSLSSKSIARSNSRSAVTRSPCSR